MISDIDNALNDSLPTKGQKRKSDENELKEDKDKVPPAKKVVLNRNTPLIEEKRISTDSKEGSDKTNGTNEEKRVIKLSSLSAKERLEMRAKKFDVSTLSTEAKKLARAERFGTKSQADTPQTKVVGFHKFRKFVSINFAGYQHRCT